MCSKDRRQKSGRNSWRSYSSSWRAVKKTRPLKCHACKLSWTTLKPTGRLSSRHYYAAHSVWQHYALHSVCVRLSACRPLVCPSVPCALVSPKQKVSASLNSVRKVLVQCQLILAFLSNMSTVNMTRSVQNPTRFWGHHVQRMVTWFGNLVEILPQRWHGLKIYKVEGPEVKGRQASGRCS